MDTQRAESSRDAIVAEARRLGFDAVGITRADVPLEEEFARYEAFLAQGLHGSMEWLATTREVRRRLDGDGILAGAKSVICLAKKYGRNAAEEDAEPGLAQGIARYARGRDYHNSVRKKLRALAKFVRRLATEDAPVEARPMADDAPVLERAWAARAGLGFIGKNGLLIVPGVGSMVLLGEVVTTLALPSTGEPLADRCGSCTRCLDVCPTKAFVAPFVLDARRCVAYLTIEHRGVIDESLHDGIGAHLFGCDDCQTACPFNAATRHRPSNVDARFSAHPRWAELSLADLVTLGEERFTALREGTPVARATRAGLARNAAIVLGNEARTRALTEPERAALEGARDDDDSDVVRETAASVLAARA